MDEKAPHSMGKAILLDLSKKFIMWLYPLQNVFVLSLFSLAPQLCIFISLWRLLIAPFFQLFSSLLWFRRAFGNVNRLKNKLIKDTIMLMFWFELVQASICAKETFTALWCAWVNLDIYSYNIRCYDFASIF